jgi:Fur family peroxide stress response transcriptional regulator
MLGNETKSFRKLCQDNGIAVTHQRQLLHEVMKLYEVMKTMHGHPSPEEVDAQGKKKVPAISAGDRFQEHTFVCRKWRLPRGEHAPWLAARGEKR